MAMMKQPWKLVLCTTKRDVVRCESTWKRWTKKTPKTPPAELEKAKRHMVDYLEGVK